jgi:hypothetical protein
MIFFDGAMGASINLENHSEMVCSSLLWARRSLSTEYGARRVGSW